MNKRIKSIENAWKQIIKRCDKSREQLLNPWYNAQTKRIYCTNGRIMLVVDASNLTDMQQSCYVRFDGYTLVPSNDNVCGVNFEAVIPEFNNALDHGIECSGRVETVDNKGLLFSKFCYIVLQSGCFNVELLKIIFDFLSDDHMTSYNVKDKESAARFSGSKDFFVLMPMRME